MFIPLHHDGAMVEEARGAGVVPMHMGEDDHLDIRNLQDHLFDPEPRVVLYIHLWRDQFGPRTSGSLGIGHPVGVQSEIDQDRSLGGQEQKMTTRACYHLPHIHNRQEKRAVNIKTTGWKNKYLV